MKCSRSDRSYQGPEYAFNKETGKWQCMNTLESMGNWRERSWHRSPPPQESEGTESDPESQKQQLNVLAWSPHLKDPSASHGEDGQVASCKILEQPLTPRVKSEGASPPPVCEEIATPTMLHGHPDRCVLCDFHLTGARLDEMEVAVEQMLQEEGSSRQKRWQSTLRRLPYSNIWPDNIYINRSHRLY